MSQTTREPAAGVAATEPLEASRADEQRDFGDTTPAGASSGADSLPNECPRLVSLEGRAEEEALQASAPVVLEEGPLGLGLDTLRDHVQIEALGQREDGLDLRRVLRVVGQPGDERAVDLEGLEAKLADPRDGEEACPEIVEGQLSDLSQASLPVIAAIGGILVPALIYAWINQADDVALQGWAIPAATDIAFTLAILALLGDRVPPSLRLFLVSIAIFDDVGAIVIIALFYTSDLSVTALSIATACLSVLYILNRRGTMEKRPICSWVR